MKIFLNISDKAMCSEIERIIQSHEIVHSELDSDLIISDSPLSSRITQVLISDKDDYTNLKTLREYEIKHLIGKTEGYLLELEQVISHLQTLPSFEDYLVPDAKINKGELVHSKEISELIEELLQGIDLKDYFESPKNNIRLILNELLTNAFFHQEGLEDKSRGSSLFSLNSIKTAIGIDDKKIVITVKDNIGKVNYLDIISAIIRGHEERSPLEGNEGAGLGVYMIYENVNQVHICQTPDESTEFICIIEENKRYKKFKERVTSFHYFRGLHE